MYNNIQQEAVFPPAVFSIRKMSYQGQARSDSKGSFDMFDPQQAAIGSFGEKRINGIGGSAPGSPGSVHDYKQVVVNLQRELEESKRKTTELQQIITDINNTAVQSAGNLDDSQFAEGSQSSDNLTENVKDAHIKHLERKVTVLQANLYKSEGWTSRAGNSMKERDKVIDEVTHLTNQIKNLEGDNQMLQQRIDMLSAKLQEAQQNLRQVTEELQGQTYSKQMVMFLQDEIQRQKSEITTLRNSIAQLEQENKSLKDSANETNSQAVGNMVCSLELEHLHLVVDKLKNIVLEQRAYLLQLKKPTNGRNTRSLSSPTSQGSSGGGTKSHELYAGRNLVSPTLRVPGCDVALGNLPQQAGLGQFNQAAVQKSAAAKDSILESKSPVQKNFNASDFSQLEMAGTRRKPSSHEMMDDVLTLGDFNTTHLLMSRGEMFQASESKPEPHIGGSSYLAENVHYKPQELLFRQHGNGGMVAKNTGQVGPTFAPVNVSTNSPLHRATKSEVLAHRNSQEKLAIANWGSKSEIIQRPTWNRNAPSDNRSPMFTYKTAGNDVDKFVQVSPGLTLNYGQRFGSAQQGQKEPGETARNTSYLSDAQRQHVDNDSTMQMLFDNSATAQYENVNRNSPTYQQQFQHLIYQPPVKQGSAQPAHNEMKPGVKHTTPRSPAPCGTSQRPNQDALYVNTSSGQSSSTPASSSPVDHDPSRGRTNPDRLCPVCSHNYSHVSMEDFQTHVLDCFEDENPPETMKLNSPPNRQCPMCNAKFGPETAQSDFEKHVHSHFSEDCIAGNFEILS